MFVNLLSNARDASPDGGRITIDALIDGDRAEITVEDRGCGVPPELRDEIFEPFVTTKDPGQGTGLGLALVYSIMEDMRGSVVLQSPLYDGAFPGTRVSLRLPLGDYGNTFEL